MLAASPLRNTKDEKQEEMESFSDGNLLESINYDDFFVGIDVDGDVLPDLEMDSELFAVSCGEESEMKEEIVIVSGRDESVVHNGKGRKSSNQSKNHQGKRKVKVDWTPELHRRFVQAVEQLGVDKAVPSRILEIMGIHCLTRHNIASHLQKYRSHRKHLLAREAEAASWNQRRQLYGVGGMREMMSPWAAAPTMGFPPPPPPPPINPQMHHFRPLHVWGHPSMDHSFMHMWPKHLPHSTPPPPPHSWPPVAAPPPPPQDPSFWHSHYQRSPNAIVPGTHCFPQPLTTARSFDAVPGIPRHGMYKADHGISARPAPGPLFDFHPSKESIDEAIGDVLSKPWLPLPLGLKAPVLDSVIGELHRQGISNIPPSSCA